MSNELTPASAVLTSGDARRLVLETMVALKAGAMDVNRGMAIAANMKVLNESIFAEVAAAKMAIQAKKEGHNFGETVEMGRKLLG